MTNAALLGRGRLVLHLAFVLATCGCADGSKHGSPSPAGDAGAEGGGGLIPCINPQPLVVSGLDTGMVLCESGEAHRAHSGRCGPGVRQRCSAEAGAGDCRTDLDCAPGLACDPAHCTCAATGLFDLFARSCEVDAECAADQVCLCSSGGGGTCITALCATDADCAPGRHCVERVYMDSYKTALVCQNPGDHCSHCAQDEICCFQGPTSSCMWGCRP